MRLSKQLCKWIRRRFGLGDRLGLGPNLGFEKLIDVELVVVGRDHVSRHASQVVALDTVVLSVWHLDLKLVNILLF